LSSVSSVTFAGVTKRFGSVTAVDELSLDVADGEFMVMLGPSGCGKSTALRMIAGLEEITSGELRIGDRVVNDVIPAKRDVSMVFQSYALYPHMTVAKNIESPLVTRPTWVPGPDGQRGELRKLSGSERKDRIDEAARMLGLEGYLDRKPGALSGGQRQRVALARAVVSRPAVFLMDEPLSNLDAKLRTQTRAELVDLHERLGTTVVYVTHDQVEAMTMADRIAILDMGRLRQVGTPREVYDTPADLFVAGFIGTPPMNTSLASIEGGIARVGDSALPVDGATRGGPVIVGVRPEHLRIDPTGPLQAKVRLSEWLGHEALLRVQPAGVESAGGWMVRLANEDHPPDPGVEVRLGLTGPIHLFDPDTGVRRGGEATP
jgi:multiple sugar transport system ATP-binding protein